MSSRPALTHVLAGYSYAEEAAANCRSPMSQPLSLPTASRTCSHSEAVGFEPGMELDEGARVVGCEGHGDRTTNGARVGHVEVLADEPGEREDPRGLPPEDTAPRADVPRIVLLPEASSCPRLDPDLLELPALDVMGAGPPGVHVCGEHLERPCGVGVDQDAGADRSQVLGSSTHGASLAGWSTACAEAWSAVLHWSRARGWALMDRSVISSTSGCSEVVGSAGDLRRPRGDLQP